MRNLLRRIRYGSLLVGVALGAWLVSSGQMKAADDPFIGKWMLDPDQSRFTPGPGPTDRTMKFEMTNKGLHHLTSTKGANGGISVIDYTANFDNHDYPVDGAAIDTVTLKHVDPMTIERVGKVRGMPAEKCTMKLSDGGKTLTMTVDGAYNGTHYASTQIYHRE